jgi:hypothetical protein
MKNQIGKNQILELLEEWKINAYKNISKSNRSIDNEEIMKLRAKSDGIYECVNQLFAILNAP